MITTTTIEKLCIQEEAHEADRRDRLALLRLLLETCAGPEALAAELGPLEGARAHDFIQLACEAIKWHQIRLDGHGVHQALDAMIGLPLA